MSNVRAPAVLGRAVRQRRSQKTYDALISTGFKLLEKREFDSITIAALAQAAGYSVGAFYSRFQSKDEFFEALVAHHLEERARARGALLESSASEDWLEALIADIANYYWRRRRFWRAALVRSGHDPAFWEPIRRHARDNYESLVARIQRDARRALSKEECTNIRFAFQLVLSAVNNRIMNRPRPSFIGQADFIAFLVRAFRLVSEYDKLVGA
ncbi:MAG TPA: TetR/AcrR family transcriptional regulator [Gammaproteobacteria bacterium]|jgi:AcrR family transcriptional regulator|nr:TetR/AcrR family transcriptional regulator [Gammaproteobacteria bacterium]